MGILRDIDRCLSVIDGAVVVVVRQSRMGGVTIIIASSIRIMLGDKAGKGETLLLVTMLNVV